jgi:imidazolonepropionase
MTFDLLLVDCSAATMAGAGYGVVRDAAIGITNGRLSHVGARAGHDARETRSLGGAWVTPGLIDCHTHLVFAGNRAPEWEMRAKGATYEEIARAGGGILSTVRATRGASEDELVAQSLPRAQAMAAHGVTTVEIKSGYGLDPDTEFKMLRAAKKVGARAGMNVTPTFLGAHALPPEYKNARTAYVDLVCNAMIPVIARDHLATSVDAFCESIAFTPEETERVFAAAKAHGLRVKLHAEQLSNSRGAILASKYDALSADHLEHLCDEGVATMASSGMVAVLLPTAFYFLRETRKPPIAALRRAGVPLAIATDCNPGTSPVASPLIALNMACTLYGLTPEEALGGMTRNAARALNSPAGTLESGKPADLAVWRISDPSELCYWIGADLLLDRYVGGKADRNWKAA